MAIGWGKPGGLEGAMKAHVGDHIVIASPTTGGTVRDGEIVEVRGADGAPPYYVRWSDGGSGLFFPGPDAHLTAPHPEPAGPPQARSWRVDIELFEAGDETTAHAVLVAEAPRRLDARGEAHRNPADAPVPVIGDEIAVARALRGLADRLLQTASADMSQTLGHQAAVTR
jgi:hypothetical protein